MKTPTPSFRFPFQRRVVLLAVLALGAFASLGSNARLAAAEPENAPADPASPRPLICAYFVPSDCEPYPDRAERLYRVMSRVQDFYRQEMERNGFGPLTFALETETPENGDAANAENVAPRLKLHEVRAPKTQLEYGRDSYYEVSKIVAESLAKEGIDANREVVVIFQRGLRWEDGKAIEVASYVGGGSPFSGTAWVYDDPLLDANNLANREPGGFYQRPVSIGQFNTHYIGGIAHELGHALTLPHHRELSTEVATLGRSLMGSGNHVFGQEERGESLGAFFTYAEALRFSVVPAICGAPATRRAVDVELTALTGTRLSDEKIRFNGKIDAENPVRGLIFYFDSEAGYSDYDAKTWTTVPEEGGAFEIELMEVAPGPAELRVCAVRDVDTIVLEKFAFEPGSADEFAPIARRFELAKIGRAFSAGDVDALNALIENDFAQNDAAKTLCAELVETLQNPIEPTVPADAEKAANRFDLARAKFDAEQVGWARLGRNRALDDALLSVGGNGFGAGLCAHAPSKLECRLGKNWETLEFSCGVQNGAAGSVVFVVRGDGRELYRSPVVKGNTVETARVSVADVETLELATEDAGDGKGGDWSVWIRPTLTR